VGLRAKERYRDGATDLVVCNFKRLIGRSYDYVAREISKGSRFFEGFKGRIERGATGEVLIKVGEKKYSIVEISSFLLKRIVAEAESEAQKLGGESIEKVVISIPAGFDSLQGEATYEAARTAGLTNVIIIEEPTAAAIAKGVQGKIMVVDVGAGTTDIVVGYIEEGKEGLHLDMANRECDDVLGGIDMDYLILEYLIKEDKNQPLLRDIYPILDNAEKGKLMAKIEEAKINASLDGSGHIVTTLRIGDKPKRISVSLDENALREIVRPLVWGYERDGELKGIKPVVEKALLSVAGNDPKKINKVKQGMEHLILIGGPCRMRCIREMLKDVFKENETVCKQIEVINPLDPFPMEAVAKGAAESEKFKGIETEVPYNISIFHWGKGLTPVIAKGESYIREEGVVQFAQVPVSAGSNILHILTEKGPKCDWPMKDYLVSVPQEGLLKITLYWSEGGMKDSKANKIQGAGIIEPIELPQINDRTNLGTEIQTAFKDYFENGVLILRQRINDARDRLRRHSFNSIAKANPQLFQLLQASPDLVLDQYRIEGVSLKLYRKGNKQYALYIGSGYKKMRSHRKSGCFICTHRAGN
jgi:molecular chaperone DnaK